MTSPAVAPRYRVALICDLVEEQWPSMDLVADMLFEHLRSGHRQEFETSQIRPPMRRRFSKIPLLGNSGLAHNGDRLLNRLSDYPRRLRQQAGQFDLYHIVDHSYAQLALELDPVRTVVTCHDLNTFRCLLEPQKEQRPRWFQAVTRRILDGMTACARVICVSASTRDEILRYGLVPPDRLCMVHNGVDPVCSPLPDPPADAIAAQLLGGERVDATPFLLHVGSTVARKRIDLLLEIFAGIRKTEPAARLVRVGGPFSDAQERLAHKLGISSAIDVLPLLDRNVLAAVYRRASALLQPSEAEGFGLPVVEALACGCSVIASDLPVFHEISGSAVTFCSLGDAQAWVDAALERIEKQRLPGASAADRRLAIKQAEQFSWTATTRKLADIYRQVLKNQRRSTCSV